MNEVLWTETALVGLRRIQAYIEQFNPQAAVRVAQSLRNAGNGLASFPHRGRPVPGSDARELIADYPYIIRYRIIDGDVVILRVRHGARRPTDR